LPAQLLEAEGIRTSSDSATIAAAAMGEARAAAAAGELGGEPLLGGGDQLLGDSDALPAAGGVSDAVVAAAVRMATRMAMARLMR